MISVTAQISQRSKVKWVLAENGFVIVAGHTQQLGTKPTAFVAKLDWNGNVVWKNELPVPGNCTLLDIYGGSNLLRSPDGRYVLGGVVQDTTTRSIPTKQPFLYRFAADGRPGAFQFLIDTLNRRYGAIHIAADGKLAMANLIRIEDVTDPSYRARPQLTLISASGAVLWVKKPEDIPGDIRSIQAILPDSSNSRYLVYTQKDNGLYENYHFASDGSGFIFRLIVSTIGFSSYNRGPIFEIPIFQMKIVESSDRNHDYFVAPITSFVAPLGVGFQKLSSITLEVKNTNITYMPEDTIPFFCFFDGYLSVLESKNRDVIYTKSVTQLLGADKLQKFTAMVRLDTAAEVSSIQYIRKITDTVAGIYQFINSTAQSPDGSKYVLAGNIENHGPRRPGVWDTVGSTS